MTPAALGAALWVLQVELPSSAPCPTHFAGSRRDICRAEVLIGMKGLAVCVSSWMDVIESEKRGKKKRQTSFGKILVKQYLLWALLSVRCKCVILSFLQQF